MSGRSGGNQIGIEESLSTSEVAQSTGEALPLGFDVNICDNIIYISGGGGAPPPLSFFPSLTPVKIKAHKGDLNEEWYFTVTEERERHSNMLMIWWWARQKMKVWEEKDG